VTLPTTLFRVVALPGASAGESALVRVPGQAAGATAATGGMSAFLGFTVLVLTGFLVLARLSQRVVDDTGETADEIDDSDEVGRPPRAEGGPVAPVEDARFDGPGEPAPSDATQAGTTVRDGTGEASIPPVALLANVALTQGLFGGVLAAAAWFFQVPGTALGLAGGRVTGLGAVGAGVTFGIALWVGNELAGALADATGAGYDEGLRQLLAPATARGWTVLLGGVLPVIALVEEFLFRAAAVGAASTWFGGTPVAAWVLAVGSSLAFALGHGAQGRVGVAVTGALGLGLAAGFVFTGSFVVVVVAHYVVNALEFLVHEGVGLPDPVWS
jgi:membrane protease YdiL (CAAX protease family)